MRIVGITAEYNPFHNGHLHHLEETLRLSGAAGAVAVMSGNYVQRGLPACVDKYRRTRMALEAGVDMVIELPIHFALSSAEGFATGAVTMLHDLGVTDIAYGCEAGADPACFEESPDADGDTPQQKESGTKSLKSLAAFLLEEPQAYKDVLKDALSSGKNFPAARQEAVSAVLGSETAALLSTPNNILAIEYEKALLRLSSPMKSHAISRNDAGYHVTGTRLRLALACRDRQALEAQMPQSSLDVMDYHVTAGDFSELLSYRLAGETKESLLSSFSWLDPELAARIVSNYVPFLSFADFCETLTTRNTTRTAVCRALTRILLGLKELPGERYPASPLPFHVLGLRKDSPILKTLKERSTRPLITKAADLPEAAFADELAADTVYAIAVYKRTGIRLPDAFHAGPVIV